MTTACSDFLELNESGYNSVEYQFSTFDRTKAVATNVYGYLKDGYSEVCSTMIDAATDDAVNAWSTNGIKGFYDGSWNTSAPIGDVWEYYYRAIAAANYFIEHCPADFPAAKYQEKYEEKLKELKLYPYEIQALRAYFHFELLKRYKNIIIADRQFTLEEVNELQPATFAEAVNWIVGECDEAAKFLPVTFKGMTSTDEVGRATKGMAFIGIVTLAASLVASWLKQFPGFSLFGALIIALLIGMVAQFPIRKWYSSRSAEHKAGVKDAAGLISNKLLRLGIILLGFKLNLTVLFTQGIKCLPIAAVVVTLTIVVCYNIARKLGVDPQLAILVAGGTGICGAWDCPAPSRCRRKKRMRRPTMR